MRFKTKCGEIIYCKDDYNKELDNDQIYVTDSIWYYKGYMLHRNDEPAIEWCDGSKEWYFNGQSHREDGPAIQWSDGDDWWYLDGMKRCKEDYWKLINLKNKNRVLDDI